MILSCDMVKGCRFAVTHIEARKGWLYCADHAHAIKLTGVRCRKLRAWELIELENGRPISYARKAKPRNAPAFAPDSKEWQGPPSAPYARPQTFVSLYGPALNTPDRVQSEHVSSLMFGGRVADGLLCVVGVLPHMHLFRPATAADRDALVTFLNSITY